MSFIVGIIVGFFIGVILTSILLANKNLERYKEISNKVSTEVKGTREMIKQDYQTKLAEYEKGEDNQC